MLSDNTPIIATLDILADLQSRDDSIAPTSGGGIVLSKGGEANISTMASIVDNISNFFIKSPFPLTQFNLRPANQKHRELQPHALLRKGELRLDFSLLVITLG